MDHTTKEQDKSSSLNTTITNLFFFLFLLVPFTLPWIPVILNSYVLSGAGGVGLLYYWMVRKNKAIKLSTSDILLIAFVLLQAIGIFYSEDIRRAYKNFETAMPLIAFPLLVAVTRNLFTDEFISRICWSFLWGVFTACVLSILNAVYTQLVEGQVISIRGLTHLNLSALMHPAYLSLYIAFTVIFLSREIARSRTKRWIKGALLLFFIVFMALLNARTSIIGFVFTSFVVIFFSLRKGKMVAFTVIVLFILLLFSLPVTRERFIQAPLRALEMKGEVDAYDQKSWAFSFRIQIYDCVLSVIREKPLFGHGTGDENSSLFKCYQEKNYTWILARRFNAHNEYFQETIKHGIVGLATLLSVMILPLILSIKSRDILYMSFLLLVMVSALTESLLSVQKGVCFFGLFYSVLPLRLKNHEGRQSTI